MKYRWLLGAVLIVVVSQASRGDVDAWHAKPDPTTQPIAKWIWGPTEAKNGEVGNFRLAFDAKLPTTHMTEDPSTAMLWAAGDDEATIFLNGKAVGKIHNAAEAIVVDVKGLLKPGINVLTATCKNTTGPAGMAMKLSVLGTYREPFYLVTDETWTCVMGDAPKGWRNKNFQSSLFQPARVLGDYGMAPWGKQVVAMQENRATPADQLTLLPGFKAELLYSVPKAEEGSWVSMANDPRGRLYVSDQGGPLYRVTVGATADDTKVEKVPAPIGHSQGMLWADDGLYVVVNGKANDCESGLYHLTDSDGADVLDRIEKVVLFKDRFGNGAGGEHGPHAVVKGPDGNLYIVAGNFTGLPESVSKNSPTTRIAEDLLLPRDPDGKGHDPTIMAPGGWVCRIDPETKKCEAVVVGLRNSYDIAFNPQGELFTYDSDMEWDIGAPWYRPTRVCHLVSGAEFGWRNGTGKWPTYYPDSIPPVVDIGLGSPTGLTFGTGAKFPAKYQRALIANDWAYGKIYAVHLTPQGASYKATFEPFVTGKPFDVTDLVINTDGAMYVLIGGRDTQSGLYRITYIGNESTEPAPAVNDPDQKQRDIRHRLEAFHGKRDPSAVSIAWPYLESSDRFLRYAARLAIEGQDLDQWRDKALGENGPFTTINGSIALIRAGDKSLEPKILTALDRLNFQSLSREERLELLRAYGLCFSRMGKPDAATLSSYAAKWDAFFPLQDVDLDHELAQLLVYCSSPTIVQKSMARLAAAKTQEEQFYYAFVIRNEAKGWDDKSRRDYFAWVKMAKTKYTGGASFSLFLDHMRDEAIKTLSDNDKKTLAAVLKDDEPAPSVAAKPARKFVKNWTMEDFASKLSSADQARSFERGKAAFEAAACIQCHKFNGKGGSLGPDITGAGARFNSHDVLESIILPSKVISDQYRDTKLVTKIDVIVGSIQSEDAEKIVIRPSPLTPQTVTVKKKEIVRRGFSGVSAMPTGLLNWLSEDEVLDLIAYVRAAGNAKDKVFAAKPK